MLRNVDQPKRIVASFLTEDQEFQRLQAEDARQEAGRSGLHIDVVFADNNAVLQIQQLFGQVHLPPAERPAAIVVETVAGEGMERVARRAAAAGVGWVLINRSVSYLQELRRDYPRLPFSSVGTDQLEVGKIQGAQLKALAPRGGAVLCVTGPSDTSVAQERLKGLRQATQASGLEVKVLEGRWTEASGEEALRRWLRLESSRGARLEAVACQNDAMAVGVLKVLETQSARPPVIGCDGLVSGGRPLVDAGRLAATIVTPSNGGPAVQLVARALLAGAMPPPALFLPPVAYPAMDELLRRARATRPGV